MRQGLEKPNRACVQRFMIWEPDFYIWWDCILAAQEEGYQTRVWTVLFFAHSVVVVWCAAVVKGKVINFSEILKRSQNLGNASEILGNGSQMYLGDIPPSE